MWQFKKEIRNWFAVATAQAKKEGYSDFSEGGAGRQRRREIAQAMKMEEQSKSADALSETLVEIYKGLTSIMDS